MLYARYHRGSTEFGIDTLKNVTMMCSRYNINMEEDSSPGFESSDSRSFKF